MKEALTRLTDLTLRPINAWPKREKLSSVWLQCLPGPDGLSSQAFTEALALLLCMPSPACVNRVGASVGRRTVDKAQVDCLLGKLHQVGPGNRQSAKGESGQSGV